MAAWCATRPMESACWMCARPRSCTGPWGRCSSPGGGGASASSRRDPEFESLFGRKADKRRKLYNGMIQCQYYQYFKGEETSGEPPATAAGVRWRRPGWCCAIGGNRTLEDFLAFAADPAGDAGLLAPRPATDLCRRTRASFRRALWDSGCYAIVLKETGRPIGKIKFQKDIRRPKGNSLSIGYELARALLGPRLHDRGPPAAMVQLRL